MSFRPEFLLPTPRVETPADLLSEANKSVPLTPDNYIPLATTEIRDTVRPVIPTLIVVGGGAIQLDMGVPFGFKLDRGGSNVRHTQHTNGATIMQSKELEGMWSAILDIEHQPEAVDEELFPFGLDYYIRLVLAKLEGRREGHQGRIRDWREI